MGVWLCVWRLERRRRAGFDPRGDVGARGNAGHQGRQFRERFESLGVGHVRALKRVVKQDIGVRHAVTNEVTRTTGIGLEQGRELTGPTAEFIFEVASILAFFSASSLIQNAVWKLFTAS